MVKDKKKLQNIALERINYLLEQAKKNEEFEDRYSSLAFKIATKYRVRLSKEQKLLICKKCQGFLRPGRSLRVRRNKGVTSYTCLKCNDTRRVPSNNLLQ